MTLSKIIVFVFLFSGQFALCQGVEVSAGLSRNHFFDYRGNDGHFISNYSPDFGYSFSVGYSDISIKDFNLYVSIIAENYNGSFYSRDGGLGSGSETNASVNKYVLGMGLYPLNISVFFNNFNLRTGIVVNSLIYNSIYGVKKSWSYGVPGIFSNIDLSKDSKEIRNNFVVGISSQIGYSFQIVESWYLLSRCDLYLSLSNEFKNVEAKIKSFRYGFQLGVIRKL